MLHMSVNTFQHALPSMHMHISNNRKQKETKKQMQQIQNTYKHKLSHKSISHSLLKDWLKL